MTPNATNPNLPEAIETTKRLRQNIDAQIQTVEHYMGMNTVNTDGDNSVTAFMRSCSIRELALVRTKLQEAKMWAGKILETMGSPFPSELADKANVQ